MRNVDSGSKVSLDSVKEMSLLFFGNTERGCHGELHMPNFIGNIVERRMPIDLAGHRVEVV